MEQSATVQLLSSAGHPVSDLHRQTLPATGNLLAYAGGGGTFLLQQSLESK